LLYVTNLLGITLACGLVFVWGGYYLHWRNVRRALRWGLVTIILLIVPLLASLAVLLRQKELRSTIKDLLQSQTITVGQQVELLKMQVNWNFLPWSKLPSTVVLTVQSQEPVTPKQVSEVEKFLNRKLKQSFQVIFRVSEFQEVTADQPQGTSPASPSQPPTASPAPGVND
jgi:uncharacterized membrane protein